MFVFNLFPLPPLDGGRILVGLLPYRQAVLLSRIEPWGFFVVMALVLTGVVSKLWMQPLMSVTYGILETLLIPLALLTQRFLTGITTSGTPHLGNYVGSIRPSVAASKGANATSFYFLADYHALIKCDEPARIQQSTLEIAASWLAAGLDPERVTFYRQSDIPQLPASTWFLT
eukprot:gene12179-16412_t